MQIKMKRARLAPMLLAVAVLAAGFATPASAAISFVDMFRNDSYNQTDDGNALSASTPYLTFDLFSRNANDYTSAQATFAGPASPAALSPDSPTTLAYSSGFYPNRAAMNADFPTGAYTLAASKGATTDTTTFNYSADAYASTVPFLTGTDYTKLQGMNPAASFAFHFSPFSPAPSATESFLFFTIFDALTGDVIYDAGFQPSTTTSLTLPANTLALDKQYAYQLIFSDRVTAASPGADFDAQIGFDERTTGLFTTAVPEPAGLSLLALGGIAMLRRRTL
jgi:MYXO-CTERM domain-containing protein